MVLGVTKNAVARRSFADISASRLRATGIEAMPGYQYSPQDGPVDESELIAAVRASGADGLLLVRLLHVDRQTRVATNYAPMTFPGYYGFYMAWVAYPDVYQYDIATAEVNLFDVRTNKLLRGGTTETFNPSSVHRESAGFSDVVIAALAKRGLLPGRCNRRPRLTNSISPRAKPFAVFPVRSAAATPAGHGTSTFSSGAYCCAPKMSGSPGLPLGRNR
jgi:hypothetical protein